MTDVNHLIDNLHTHPDPVERFLALYDMNRLLTRGRPTVADAARMIGAIQEVVTADTDHNVRAWAQYYLRRMMGKPIAEAPFMPRTWRLLIVE
ncbi:MAG: hypothetical protein AAFV33_21925 [Chloroflexota bacterium]